MLRNIKACSTIYSKAAGFITCDEATGSITCDKTACSITCDRAVCSITCYKTADSITCCFVARYQICCSVARYQISCFVACYWTYCFGACYGAYFHVSEHAMQHAVEVCYGRMLWSMLRTPRNRPGRVGMGAFSVLPVEMRVKWKYYHFIRLRW